MNFSATQTVKNKPSPKQVQTKLQVNEPGDVYEQEADAMANRVMQMRTPANNIQAQPVTGLIGRSVQRKCAKCEEEEKNKVMRKEQGNSGGAGISTSFANSLQGSKGNGFALPASTQSHMENAFGVDFSGVRIHTGNEATAMSTSIQAKAFTYGNDIYFNQSQYEPQTDSGRHLLAHELTHVVQQSGAQQPVASIQRAIGNHSSCAANTHNSPATPIDVLREVNDRAVTMALGASNVLFADSLFMQDPTFGSSGILNMYRGRFGDPAVVPVAGGSRFKNRFNNTLHNTMILAQASEMRFLSNRSRRIGEFLNGPIHFKCTGTSHTTIGNCNHHCNPGDGAAACHAGHQRTIAICPGFWNGYPSIDQKAVAVIHEVMHMVFHFSNDFDTTPASTSAQRRIEPECYASLIADIFGVAPVDLSCPVI